MKKLFPLLALSVLLFTSCSQDEEPVDIDPYDLLTEYEKEVVSYFEEIALGFEFGTATEVTRKWNSDMNIFVGGETSPELQTELAKIITEVNNLASDGFDMKIVNDTLQSNYYIFLGSDKEYENMFPHLADNIASNWGLFNIWYQGNYFTRGHMYVDTHRTNAVLEQRHLLREELTQSLGLAKDSYSYPESIFQQNWTTTIEYAAIDRELIRLLYHPRMKVGLTKAEVREVLVEILLDE